MSAKTQKVLLIEDNQWLREMYEDQIKHEGYKVFGASSAQEGLDVLDNNEKIDLIILDIMLPGHNGIAALYELRSYEDWQHIPVVLLSALPPRDFDMHGEIWQHLGVKKYLYKPATKPTDLLNSIQTLLSTA